MTHDEIKNLVSSQLYRNQGSPGEIAADACERYRWHLDRNMSSGSTALAKSIEHANQQIAGRRNVEPKVVFDLIGEAEAEVERLSLALIEARNPGIDMDDVKAERAVRRG